MRTMSESGHVTSDVEMQATLAALLRGDVRLQGGATSEAGWSIIATSDGQLLRTDWEGTRREVRFCTPRDAEDALKRYGMQVVVPLRRR